MRTPVTPDPRRLGAFWFGIQVVWTAVIGVVLQDRVTALAPNAVAAYATIAATGALFAAVVQVVAGIVSDRVRARLGHRRPFYALGVAIAVPGLVVLPWAPSLAWLWAAWLVLQLGMNVGGGPYQGIVGDYVPADRIGRASGWMSVHQFSGSVTGIVLTTLLHGAALGVALAVALAGAWWITDAHAARLARSPDAVEPLRIDAPVRIVLISRALINVGFYTLFGFLFFFVRESLGIADARTATGILILVFTLAGVAGAALAGRASDRIDKRVVVTVACAAIAVAVGAFALAPTFPVAVACALGSGAAWGAFFTADWAIAYAVLPRTALAAAMGVWNLAAAIPQVIAPAITGPLVQYVDARRSGLGPRVALACVIVEFALGTAWLWRLRAASLSRRCGRRDRHRQGYTAVMSLRTMALVGGLILATPVFASAAGDDAARAVATTAAAKLEQFYVFPARGHEAAQLLQRNAAAGAYDGLRERALASKITADLVPVLHDVHVRVGYNRDINPPDDASGRGQSAAEQAAMEQFFRSRGYGIARVGHLPGNVGYVDLRFFAPSPPALAAVDAALNTVATSDAIVLDLRRNHGGSPDAVARVLSHVLQPKIHLNDFVARGDGDPKIASSTFTSEVPGAPIAVPLYVLTSGETVSGGEECAYDVQALKRGTLVGAVTAGGANPGDDRRIDDHFSIFVPDARARNPITGTNWEGTGVNPDVRTSSDRALATAYGFALDGLLRDRAMASDERDNLRALRARLDRLSDAQIFAL